MKCAQGDTNALKLWLSYRFGLPKQQIDVTSNGEKIAPPIQWIGKRVAIEQAKIIQDDEQSENKTLIQLERNNIESSDKSGNQFDIWL
jgi:hypothetical protein